MAEVLVSFRRSSDGHMGGGMRYPVSTRLTLSFSEALCLEFLDTLYFSSTANAKQLLDKVHEKWSNRNTVAHLLLEGGIGENTHLVDAHVHSAPWMVTESVKRKAVPMTG